MKCQDTQLKVLLPILSLDVCFVSCKSNYTYQPEQTNDGWEIASLSDVGIDEKPSKAAISNLEINTHTQ